MVKYLTMKSPKPLISIVATSPSLPGVVSLLLAAKELHCDAVVLKPDDKDVNRTIDNSDFVAFRTGPKSLDKFRCLLKILNGKYYQVLQGVICSFDKIKINNVLNSNNIPTPKSWVVQSGENYENYPFVIKVPIGYQGEGVGLIRNASELETFYETYSHQDKFLAQEYIIEAKSKDKRLFVVGDRVIAAMERYSTSDDFRANLHRGAKAKSYIPSNKDVDMAIKAASLFNLDYAGVDIIDSSRGPLVLEVNPSPGFGISKITGINVAKELISLALKGKRE